MLFRVFRIHGTSMVPTLHDGDFIIALNRLLKVKRNRLVVVQHPEYGTLVKRIVHIDKQGKFLLGGDNQSSLSSVQIGWMTPKQVLGRVLISIKKPGT